MENGSNLSVARMDVEENREKISEGKPEKSAFPPVA
jgi:hypothetical protein